jgi:ABC-2 type transport system permease protein
MATTSIALPHRVDMPRLYAREAKYEFLSLLRRRSFTLATIGFPVMFYLLFAVATNRGGHGAFQVGKYLLGGYACFGVVGASLFGIGVGLSLERTAGWLDLKRASPMPAPAYLLAKCLSAMAFGAVIASILTVLAITLAGVSLSALEFVKLLSLTVLGAIPFASMGLMLALLVPPNAAPGVVNLVYLPMSFCGGLWMPLEDLPHWLQKLAPALPTYHLAQLLEGVFGYAQPGTVATHSLMLLGFTLCMLGISWIVFQRAEQKA